MVGGFLRGPEPDACALPFVHAPLHPVRPRASNLAVATSFPRIAASLAAAGRDPIDRDAFLMDREVVALLRELRPDEGAR